MLWVTLTKPIMFTIFNKPVSMLSTHLYVQNHVFYCWDWTHNHGKTCPHNFLKNNNNKISG